MPVPNEITYTDMSQLFASGECNGQGSRHVVDGALIRVSPCKCVTCESGKADWKQTSAMVENRLAAARRALSERKNNRQSN